MDDGAQVRIPDSIAWMHAVDDGRAWLESLPALLASARRKWSLTVGEPYEGSHVSLVLPAVSSGERVALKLQFPHREAEHEADALRAWNGDGAARLLDDAPELNALLLERCDPGTPLAGAPQAAALPVFADIVKRLSIPAAGPFIRLEDEARRWATELPARWDAAGRPFEGSLLDRAVELLDALAGTQGEQVLVHQDLHAKNVLAAQREPWLAIDPKPLVGEIEFALAPIVRSNELGHSREAVLDRLDTLVDSLGIDGTRARDWCIAQTIAWSISGEAVFPRHLDTARWLLAA